LLDGVANLRLRDEMSISLTGMAMRMASMQKTFFAIAFAMTVLVA
jgi:hypothetical protein